MSANEKRLIDATPDDCIKKTKRKTNFAKIIVSGTAEKPYYDIMWFDYMDGQYHIGYGSYNLDFVFQWLSECFEIEDAPTVDAVEVVRIEEVKQELLQTIDEFIEEYRRISESYVDHFGGKADAMETARRLVNAALTDLCSNSGAKMDGGNDNA